MHVGLRNNRIEKDQSTGSSSKQETQEKIN